MVAEAVEALPEKTKQEITNVDFRVEDDSPQPDRLLGLYQGVPLTKRTNYGFGYTPDTIIIFRLPHLRHCDSIPALKKQVRVTVMHEIGHYFGLDDHRLHELGY